MISRANTVNLNNMPVVSEEEYTPSLKDSTDVISWLSSKFSAVTTGEADKWKITKFETTPPMSTYIVAFANGAFEYLEDSYTSPLSGKVRPLRLYATKDVIHQGQFALEVKKKVLPLYEQIFDIEYPLPKLDTLVVSNWLSVLF
jgi:aminopeptidase 2